MTADPTAPVEEVLLALRQNIDAPTLVGGGGGWTKLLDEPRLHDPQGRPLDELDMIDALLGCHAITLPEWVLLASEVTQGGVCVRS